MAMSAKEFDDFCEREIAAAFPDPPYVLVMPYDAGYGETIAEDDHGAVYSLLTLRAALDDATQTMSDEEQAEWVRNQVAEVASRAMTWEDAVMEAEWLTPPCKRYAVRHIADVALSSYDGDGASDYRFNNWLDDTVETYWNLVRAGVIDPDDEDATLNLPPRA